MGAAEEGSEPEVDVEDDESEEEQLTSEWHTWVFAILVVAGVVLLVAPRGIFPELVGSLAPLLVVLGVVGWITKRALARGDE